MLKPGDHLTDEQIALMERGTYLAEFDFRYSNRIGLGLTTFVPRKPKPLSEQSRPLHRDGRGHRCRRIA
jgi:hypothetical protein